MTQTQRECRFGDKLRASYQLARSRAHSMALLQTPRAAPAQGFRDSNRKRSRRCRGDARQPTTSGLAARRAALAEARPGGEGVAPARAVRAAVHRVADVAARAHRLHAARVRIAPR